MPTVTDRSRRFPVHRIVLVLLPVLFWVACTQLTPRQGWNPVSGPVVPHDSFPADCSLCHMGTNWHSLRPDFAFDHAARTGVELQGAHAKAACLLCHNDRGPVGQFAHQGCGGCHADPHRGELGRTCADCHDERTWRPKDQVAGHDRSRFPLVGAHAAVACFRCHPGAQVGNFAGASSACEHCHTNEFARSSFDHVTAGFTVDCQRCHRPLAWAPARFDHPAGFPLTFGHSGRACSACHTNGSYRGLDTQCSSCHLTQSLGVTEPDHGGFSTDCASCHTTRGWRPASFDHPASFALTQRHGGLSCSACHQRGSYAGLATRCDGCHLAAYQRTTNPDHAGFGYPTNCETCHTTAGWRPANFAHRFPISGPHRLTCSECHRESGNASVWSCTHCHEHSQAQMASDHREVTNYQWLSAACYQCHPQGRH